MTEITHLCNYIKQRPWWSALIIAMILYALYQVWQQRWVCDDAFISFRYALQLGRGHGLVYNPGEFVEGYTNFLWTIIFAPWLALGQDPRPLVYVLGLLLFAALLMVQWRLDLILQSRIGMLLVPLAVILLALFELAQIYATGGLETTLFALLNLLGVYLLINRSHIQTDQAVRSTGTLAMLAFTLAALTRPEGLLYYAIATAYLLFESPEHSVKRILQSSNKSRAFLNWLQINLKTHLPLLCIFIPYIVWRYYYYGWLLPNTYYAKAMGASSWAQGFVYLKLFLKAYYIFFIIPVAVLAWSLVSLRRRKRLGESLHQSDRDMLWLLLLPILLYFSYYVYAGGGFMFGRFLIPFAAQLCLLLAYLLRRSWPGMQGRRRHAYLLACLMLAIAMALPFDPFHHSPMLHGIVREERIYTRAILEENIQKVIPWRDTFRKHNIRIAIRGSQAVLAYYIDAPYVLEAAQGLTDQNLAHGSLDKSSGRVGHNRNISIQDLQERQVDLDLGPRPLAEATEADAIIMPGYESLPQRIITFDQAKLRALQSELGARFNYQLEQQTN